MQENKIVKRIPTNLVTKTIITSSAEYESNKEYTDEDANIYEKYLQAITNVSIDINNDIEKIKALEDNILDQYNKNVELADKMEQETEKFAKQANTAIEDYNSNAEAKIEKFNTNAKEKTDEFNSNATEKKTEISDIAEGVKNMATAIQTEMANKKDGFDTNAEEKTNTFNSNVETKTTEFNNNSNAKTEEFNNNSTEKINAFNSNAEEKIADYNEHVETLTSRIADLEEETEDLFNALDTEKISGNELYIDDAKACRVISNEIDGMYKQETTSGATKATTTSNSVTYSGLTIETDNNNIFTLNGTPSENLNKMDTGFINGTYILQPGDNYCHIEYLSGTLNYADSSIKNGFILNIRGTGTQIINANNNTTTVENYKTHRVKKFTLTEEEKITLIQIMTHNNLTFNNLKLRIWWSTSIENLYEPYTGRSSITKSGLSTRN
nr:MAG TPA_asm: invasion associated secreted endopeptidase [Caudoviricetes sp.]